MEDAPANLGELLLLILTVLSIFHDVVDEVFNTPSPSTGLRIDILDGHLSDDALSAVEDETFAHA